MTNAPTHHQPTDAGDPPVYGSTSRWARLPWWAIVLVLSGLVLLFLIISDGNYRDTFQFLLMGVVVTLRITIISYVIAIVLGLLAGLARTSNNVVLYNIATFYVEVIRGIPIIVLLLYFAFIIVPLGITAINAIGMLGTSLNIAFLQDFFEGMANFSIRRVSLEARAIIALGVAYGAFEAEIFRAGIQSIGRGQIEAARSLGMNYFKMMRLVILPQAVRRVLPPLGNDFIALLKDSSLATVLAVSELTQLSRLRRSSTFRVVETFNVTAYLYLALTLFLSVILRTIERRVKIEE